LRRIGFWVIIKALVAAALLIYLVNRIEPVRMYNAFMESDHYLILIAVAMAPLNIFWLFLRWRYLIKYIDKQKMVSNREVLVSVMSGTALRVATPGGLGESGRIFYIEAMPRPKLFALSVIDALASLTITVIIGFLGLAFITGISLFYLNPLLYISLIVGLYGLRNKLNLSKLRFFNSKMGSAEFWDVLRNIPYKYPLTVTIMALAMYIGFIGQYVLCLNAFQRVGIFESGMAFSAMMLVKTALPISLGDLGVREGAAIYFLSKIGIGEAKVMNTSLLIFTFNMLVPAIIGTIFIPKFKIRSRISDENRAMRDNQEVTHR
jgi:uncharacterized membrane protein YbhN (UPF0104 family)